MIDQDDEPGWRVETHGLGYDDGLHWEWLGKRWEEAEDLVMQWSCE